MLSIVKYYVWFWCIARSAPNYELSNRLQIIAASADQLDSSPSNHQTPLHLYSYSRISFGGAQLKRDKHVPASMYSSLHSFPTDYHTY